jgi:putative component of membrane protein insertase Oxa1/YidC/SpoIIIJ protein YidD
MFPLFICAEIGYIDPWGKDHDLFKRENFEIPPPSEDILSKSIESIILFHQNIISPADGPRSHFRPTSARYMLLSIRRYGLLKGFIMGCDRLQRENKDPWVYRTIVIDKIKFKWDPTIKRTSRFTSPLFLEEKKGEMIL